MKLEDLHIGAMYEDYTKVSKYVVTKIEELENGSCWISVRYIMANGALENIDRHLRLETFLKYYHRI
jgi:hypothetical protein